MARGFWVRYPAGVGLFFVKFACSPGVCVGSFSSFLPLSKDMQVNWWLYFARRCECDCKWLFVSICQAYNELATCPGWIPQSPNVSWTGSMLQLWSSLREPSLNDSLFIGVDFIFFLFDSQLHTLTLGSCPNVFNGAIWRVKHLFNGTIATCMILSTWILPSNSLDGDWLSSFYDTSGYSPFAVQPLHFTRQIKSGLTFVHVRQIKIQNQLMKSFISYSQKLNVESFKTFWWTNCFMFHLLINQPQSASTITLPMLRSPLPSLLFLLAAVTAANSYLCL